MGGQSTAHPFRPQGGAAAHVSAKAGVAGLTKVAAIDNGKHGVRDNAVAPGAIDTPMPRAALDARGTKGGEFAPELSLLNRLGRVAKSPRPVCGSRPIHPLTSPA
ncbi:SDR family oxidoreductase [Streptomyces sp. NPDC059582]|uniref:SDR family oxidoreductase n=1 Tax=Streptomyces sp. NPDC059582 TaxID=3346875 RepID=UPI0036ABA603